MIYMLAVGMISFSLMALEICLTRVFSCMIWYHLSFFTISLAMLGFSLGGLILLFYPSLKQPGEMRTVPACTALFAISVAAGTLFVLFKPQVMQTLLSWFRLSLISSIIIYFAVMISIFIVAFVFSGLSISTAITQKVAQVGHIYFSNLIGSGLGCIVIVGALSYLAAFKSMLLIIAIAAVAALFFGGLRRFSKALYMLNIIVLLGSFGGLVLMDNSTIFATSLLVRNDVTESNRVYREWNSFSVVDFYRQEKNSPSHFQGLWGLSSAYKGELPEPIMVVIDSWAATSINKVEKNTLGLKVYEYLPSNLAYRLKSKPEVLIIGAGGGIDVLAALHYGASNIHAVEINPSIVRAVKTRFADFAGHIYDHPGVEVIVGEGRHIISRDKNSYDMIQLSGVDTLSGAQSSSYSFSESYLYTREAFNVYWNHLKPNGIITFLRFEFDKPRETLRLLTTAAETLRTQGIQDISKHAVIIHSNQHVFTVTLLKKDPFSKEELQVLEKAVEQNGFRFLYHPYKKAGNEFDAFVSSDNWPAYYAAYPYRISPVSDDNPFFFFYTKFTDLFRLPDSKVYAILYWTGQTILFYGSALVLLLSVVFIGWPLFRLRRQGRLIPGQYRFIVYFLSLGLAFMFVEILLMQRFTLLLGQPIYSLALVLFCLLIFAAIGSYYSRRLTDESAMGAAGSFILLIAVLLATLFLTGWIFDVFLKASLLVRIVISVLLLAPSSFLMGLPFPLGMRIAHASSPEMVPWGWTINGYASVLGAFLSIILGIVFGFTVVYFIAVVLYGLSALILLSLYRQLAA
jgi:spermidine synthase